MKKLKKDTKDYSKSIITMGVSTAVGAGVASKAPAGTPNMMGGFTAMSGMMPIAGTAMMGGHAIRITKKMNKKRKRRKH